MSITFEPIGIIHTPFAEPKDMPIQGALRPDIHGTIEIYPAFEEGLKDIDGFSHLIVLYHFHHALEFRLISKPFLDDTPRGVFAIRGPRRPNPIGFTIVRLIKHEGPILHIAGVDMVDGTPLLDIKPYFADIDAHPDASRGWMGNKLKSQGHRKQADDRFLKD